MSVLVSIQEDNNLNQHYTRDGQTKDIKSKAEVETDGAPTEITSSNVSLWVSTYLEAVKGSLESIIASFDPSEAATARFLLAKPIGLTATVLDGYDEYEIQRDAGASTFKLVSVVSGTTVASGLASTAAAFAAGVAATYVGAGAVGVVAAATIVTISANLLYEDFAEDTVREFFEEEAGRFEGIWSDFAGYANQLGNPVSATALQNGTLVSSDDEADFLYVRNPAGNNTIILADKIYAISEEGSGDDIFKRTGAIDQNIGGGSWSIIDGGAGNDTLDYSAIGFGLDISIASGSTVKPGASNPIDVFDHIEHVIGTGYADTLTGGGAVENTLEGGAGDDVIYGADGASSLTGGADNDQLFGFDGADTMDGGTGDDTISGGDGANSLVGGDGNDALLGGEGNDRFNGGSGNDTVLAGSGTDTIDGGSGIDAISYALSSTGVNLTIGNITDVSGVEAIIATIYADTIGGDSLDNIINGKDENDSISGGAGEDTLLGGDGDDTLAGGADADLLEGGAEDDLIYGTSASAAAPEADTLYGGEGEDTLYGGDGSTLYGGNGADVLHAAQLTGAYHLFGGAGADTYQIANGSAVLNPFIGFDLDVTVADSDGDFTLKFEGVSFTSITISSDENNPNELRFGFEAGDGDAFPDAYLYYWDAEDVYYLGKNLETDPIKIENISGYISANQISLVNGAVVFDVTPEDTTVGGQNSSGFTYDIDLDLQTGSPINGTANADNLSGSSASEAMNGMGGDDTLSAGDGNDTLEGGAGKDKLTGGAGADVFKFTDLTHSYYSNSQFDQIADFQVGVDKIDVSALGFTSLTGNSDTQAGELRLAYSAATNRTYVRTDQSDFEFYLDGNYAGTLTHGDFIFAPAADATINGSAAAETLTGTAANELIYGLGGNDTISAGDGNDTIDGGAGTDKMTGGAGADIYRFTLTSDSIRTGQQYDRITDYQDGTDKFDLSGLGFTGVVTGTAAAGQLRLHYSSTSDRTYVRDDHGSDFEFYLNGNHLSNLGNSDFIFSTVLNGTASSDNLLGASANESIHGLAGEDTIEGGLGNDTVNGGAGKDKFTGGSGADIFKFTATSDSVRTGQQYDRITDYQDGIDKFDLSGLGFTGVVTGTAAAGQLRVHYSSTSDRTYVRDDHGSDFEFYLNGNHLANLGNSDFIFT